MAIPILLVDDDPDTEATVRTALGSGYDLIVKTSRAGALGYLREGAAGIRGVIVDLNLTSGMDNFGRDILQRLTDLQIPCIVFSSSVSAVEAERRTQAELFRNEFGVLDTLGKGDRGNPIGALQELRDQVAKMVDVSLESYKANRLRDLDALLAGRAESIENDYQRGVRLAEEASRVTGAKGRARLVREAEDSRRLSSDNLTRMRGDYEARLLAAASFDDVDMQLADLRTELGI